MYLGKTLNSAQEKHVIKTNHRRKFIKISSMQNKTGNVSSTSKAVQTYVLVHTVNLISATNGGTLYHSKGGLLSKTISTFLHDSH